jgi:hypothetical protein
LTMQITSKNGAAPKAPVTADPAQSTKDAGLRYVTDAKKGYSRKRHGKSFRYFDLDDKPLNECRHSGAHPQPGDPTGMEERLDLPFAQWSFAGDGPRCPRAQAEPLSPTVART